MDAVLGKSGSAQIIKKEKVLKVHWQLSQLKPQHDRKQVRGCLKMPANLSSKYKGEGISLPVVLEFFDEHEAKPRDRESDKILKERAYEDRVHAFTLMRDSSATNILHGRLFLEGKCPLFQFVEPYDGTFADYLVSKKLGISEFVEAWQTIVLPTPNLSSAVSQLVEGIKELMVSGNYHGNLTLENTLYIINTEGALVLKLSGFKRKRGSRKEILAADWHSLACELRKISEQAKKLNLVDLDCPKISTCQLDGLTEFLLRDIGPMNAEVAYQSIKKQPFFWGKPERKVFYIHTIPLALKKKQFLANLRKTDFTNCINLPWASEASNEFDGFLEEMDNYRKKHGLAKYNTKCPISFVQFISGLYTHEEQIQVKLRVDIAVQKRYPMLCYKLYCLLPGTMRIKAG